MGEVCAASRVPPLSHPTPAQRQEQRPLLNTLVAAPRPLLWPNEESRAGVSSPRPPPNRCIPTLDKRVIAARGSRRKTGPASLPHRLVTPLLRLSQTRPPELEARGIAHTRPASSLLPCGEAPAPPRSYSSSARDARGGEAGWLGPARRCRDPVAKARRGH